MSKEIALDILKKDSIDKSILQRICRAYSLEIYGDSKKAHAIYCDIFNKLHKEECSVHEVAVFLFAVSEHARINRDKSIITSNIDIINNMVKRLIEASDISICNIFGENGDRINTSTLGMIYGSLITINNYLKSDEISRKVKDIKNFVFLNNISKGTLVNGNIGREISIDIIFTVVPFGMFSPEDLVMVEAVKEIESKLVSGDKAKRYLHSDKEDAVSTLLLAWYYAEKGNYNRAKVLLKSGSHLGIRDVYEAFLYLVIAKKLELIGEIGKNTIIHKPYGNFNRYEPQIYERFPKEPKAREKVLINAVTWPMYADMKVLLTYVVNGEKMAEEAGQFMSRGAENFWQWEIGPFFEKDEVKYYISIEDDEKIESDTFKFSIPSERRLYSVNELKKEGNIVNIYVLDKEKEESTDFNIILNENGGIDIGIGAMSDNSAKTPLKYEILDNGNFYTIDWNKSLLEIQKEPFMLTLYTENKLIVQSIEEGIRYYKENNDDTIKIKCNFRAQENEKYYGFGERYNNINQTGNSPDLYVYNQYKEQGIRTYIPVPFFVSSKGYGIYVNTSSFVQFDMEKNKLGEYSFSIEEGKTDFTIIPGKPKEVISEFTNMTGKPVMLPKWGFGPWMSSNNWDSEAEVRKQVELTNKYEIPSTVLVIEAWSDEATYYIFNDAVYEENDGDKSFKYSDFKFPKWGRWPDPKGMVKYLHDNGLRCILWQIPIIKYMNGLHHLQKDADEEFFIKSRYYVKDNARNPYRMPEGWFKDSLLMDFSNPQGRKWWFEKRKYLIEDIKVDGFKTDGGEFVFGKDLLFYDGKTGNEMRNLYPNDYVQAYYNFINEKNPEGGITFSRSGFTGAQKFPAHWAGDERSNFKAFKSSIIAGLNSGISGIPFWGWDLGGFSGEIPTAELFIRATQMAAFCPIMQYHAESKAEFNQDRTPWNIAERSGDKRVLNCYRFYANFRMNLLPYIYNEALKCSISGIPLMRAMFIEYPEDKKCSNITDQYLFGDGILVAPVVEEGEEGRKIYLPEGNWIDFWDNQFYEGGREYNYFCGFDKIPVFIKDGTAIPLNLNDTFELGGSVGNRVDHYNNLCFRIFGQKIFRTDFADDLGNSFKINFVKYNRLRIETKTNLDNFYLILDKSDIDIQINEFKIMDKFNNSSGNHIIKLQK